MIPARLLVSTSLATLLIAAGPASAAEVRPIGALDLTLGGRFYTFGAFGQLDNFFDSPNAGSYDLSNDTEIYFRAAAKDEATGLEYGARIELEADADASANADETWAFIKGRFGEFRFGDEDGVAKEMALQGSNVAVASGGIDGEIFDFDALAYILDSDSTKVVYYSPRLSGFQLGASFTPNDESSGKDIAVADDGGLSDYLEGGLNWKGKVGGWDLRAGVTGAYGHFNQDTDGRSNYAWGLTGGLGFTVGSLDVEGGLIRREFADADTTFFNVGAAYKIGPGAVSLNWGQTITSSAPRGEADRRTYELVLGLEIGVAPGLRLGFEGAYFDVSTLNDDGRFDGKDAGLVGAFELLVDF